MISESRSVVRGRTASVAGADALWSPPAAPLPTTGIAGFGDVPGNTGAVA